MLVGGWVSTHFKNFALRELVGKGWVFALEMSLDNLKWPKDFVVLVLLVGSLEILDGGGWVSLVLACVWVVGCWKECWLEEFLEDDWF